MEDDVVACHDGMGLCPYSLEIRVQEFQESLSNSAENSQGQLHLIHTNVSLLVSLECFSI